MGSLIFEHLIHVNEQLLGIQFNFSEYHKTHLKEYKEKVVFNNLKAPCFKFHFDPENSVFDTSYYVGVDWLEKQKVALFVESKLNNTLEVDVLGMLFDSMKHPENLSHLEGLLHVEYDSPWIEIPNRKDILSPFLIVQFLSLVKNITRKGLKKNYYTVKNNLRNKVKGKVLVGEQIKQNVFKNKLTNTVCEYQEFGIDHVENQFLNLVIQVTKNYISEHNHLFNGYLNSLNETIAFCLPAFENVRLAPRHTKTVKCTKNTFYPEYSKAIELGEAILKYLSFNITKANQSTPAVTPPFWIDMSKLFELYVYGKLKELFSNPNDLSYHDKFKGGKETDILIKADEFKCVIDCKYKPKYEDEAPSLKDKRQLAGYTRLKSVYDKLGVDYNEVIRGLIIYSHQSCKSTISKDDLFSEPIKEYIDFFKLGISLPVIQSLHN